MTEVELRQAITGALKRFQAEPLADAATHLWEVLGYASKKRLPLKPNTLSNFLSMFSHGRTLNDRYAKPDDWKSVDFLFQLTDEEVRAAANQQFNFESKGAYNGSIINSYLFFTIELKGSHYSRSTLAGITREVNKLFDMPALILFRHGETLTLAIVNRRLHKREAGKDVLDKVTLIHDIQVANTHRAHIDILADLSLSGLHRRHPFTNFVGLHEAWQKTLDTSELNKRFFQDLANWYFWALPQVRFPKNAPKDADGQDSQSLIRLITRIIFCWFLKEKGLLPEALFDEHIVPTLLNDLRPEDSTYYKAILQNLFFATLNQEMDKREFRKSGQNFMAHNLYRYQNLLKSPSDVLKLLSEVPFMNGGLFECLDKTLGTKEKPQYSRIDGFSDRADNSLAVPNDLFWGHERVVDLSGAYGETRFRSSKVAGLIRILNRYKFTVTENTPIEEEVALDPELLGKVFENLLAAYNPETGATARKQTGSFYTPREIVNSMVDNALIASLTTKLAGTLSASANIEERLRHLFAYNDQHHQFAEHEVVALIRAVDHLKILDPACGSGAFPMGILHKLVFVLTKLDPGNQRWKARQLSKAEEIPDSTVRERVVADIEQSFRANELDYGRKLYLIENGIYGVDIQPIAVQISKLRCFISLVVEQKVNKQANNCGIRPLPNLETKFVAANTLIGIQRPGQQLLRNLDVEAKEVELRHVRERHFLARTPASKAKYREQDADLREEIARMFKHDGWDASVAKALSDWDPYDQNSAASFFDREWMFGMTEGFDIVIGNPPYGIVFDSDTKAELQKRYLSFRQNADIYTAFFEQGVQLLRGGGEFAFITPNTYLNGDYFKTLRQFLSSETTIHEITDYKEVSVFDDPTVFVAVLLCSAVKPLFPYNVRLRIAEGSIKQFSVLQVTIETGSDAQLKPANPLLVRLSNDPRFVTLESLFLVKDVGFNYWTTGRGKKRGQNSIGDRVFYSGVQLDKKDVPFLKGRDVSKWVISPATNFLRHDYESLLDPEIDTFRFSLDFLARRPKVVYRQTSTNIVAAIDYSGRYLDKTVHLIVPISNWDSALSETLLVGLLNSKLFRYLYSYISQETEGRAFAQVKTTYIKRLPVPREPFAGTRKIQGVVEKILCEKSSEARSVLEAELDQAVLQLYGITSEEELLLQAVTA